MTIQASAAVLNAMLNAIETEIGTSPILRIRSGPKPANVAAASSGTVLATITLGSDWADAASGGSKSFGSLPITDASADNSGTAGHWEMVKSDTTTRVLQGDVSLSGGGADMILSTLSIISAASFSILAASFNLTASL